MFEHVVIAICSSNSSGLLFIFYYVEKLFRDVDDFKCPEVFKLNYIY